MDYCATLRRVQRNHTEAWAEHIVYRIIRPNGLAILFHNKAAGRPHSGPAALGHRGPLPAGNTTCASELTPEPSDLMEGSRGPINAPQTLRRGIARSQVRVKSPPYGRCLCAEISRRLLPPTPAPFRHIDEMIPLRANTAMTKATMSPIGGNPSQLSLAAGR
jgi:hypothetical protein